MNIIASKSYVRGESHGNRKDITDKESLQKNTKCRKKLYRTLSPLEAVYENK